MSLGSCAQTAARQYIKRVNAPKILYLVHFGLFLVRRSTDFCYSFCYVLIKKDKALAMRYRLRTLSRKYGYQGQREPVVQPATQRTNGSSGRFCFWERESEQRKEGMSRG